MKRCRKCGETKPLTEFHKSANSPDGRQYRCKQCAIAAARQWQLEHPEASRAADKKYRSTDGYKAKRKARREGSLRERILEQKRESHARHRERNNEVSRRYSEEHRDSIKVQRARYYQNNRDVVLDRNMRWQKKNIEQLRAYRRLRAYGISTEQFDQLMLEQSGLCAICGDQMTEHVLAAGTRTSICVDHDHATGRVRGLLCPKCNIGIGQFDDDPGRLRAAIRYLELHQPV